MSSNFRFCGFWIPPQFEVSTEDVAKEVFLALVLFESEIFYGIAVPVRDDEHLL